MKKFEVGEYRTDIGSSEVRYWIEKVTAKTVTVTIHKGSGRYEKTKRCKVVDCGVMQYCEAFGLYIESDHDKIQ